MYDRKRAEKKCLEAIQGKYGPAIRLSRKKGTASHKPKFALLFPWAETSDQRPTARRRAGFGSESEAVGRLNWPDSRPAIQPCPTARRRAEFWGEKPRTKHCPRLRPRVFFSANSPDHPDQRWAHVVIDPAQENGFWNNFPGTRRRFFRCGRGDSQFVDKTNDIRPPNNLSMRRRTSSESPLPEIDEPPCADVPIPARIPGRRLTETRPPYRSPLPRPL